LTGLIDFGKVSDIADGLSGIGEVGSICTQVREEGGQCFISDTGDSEKVFSREGIIGFLGREELLDLGFQFFDRRGEVFDMSEEDLEGGCSVYWHLLLGLSISSFERF
jgi:hypothetical protein